VSPDDLARLKELLAKATPGDWQFNGPWETTEHGLKRVSNGGTWGVDSEDGQTVAPACTAPMWGLTREDAELIADLKNAAPSLISAAERLAEVTATWVPRGVHDEQKALTNRAVDRNRELEAKLAEVERWEDDFRRQLALVVEIADGRQSINLDETEDIAPRQVMKLRQVCDALRAQLVEAQADTERLDWLISIAADWSDEEWEALWVSIIGSEKHSKDGRDAIDAAALAQRKQNP
jgi:hypothetical protein